MDEKNYDKIEGNDIGYYDNLENLEINAMGGSSNNPTPNTAYVGFNYTVDPTQGITLPASTTTNTVSVYISPDTLPVKSVNQAYATVGDTLTYTIVWTNALNVTQTNIVFLDTLPAEVSFVPNSLTLNGVVLSGATITPPNGVSVGSIPIGGVDTLTFQVVVNTIPTVNPIPNTATVTFNYINNPILGTTTVKSRLSNTVTTQVNFANITNPIKAVDKDYADVGDTLTYTITLKNSGNITASDIVFIDTIPNNTTLVPNSLMQDGTTIAGTPNAPGVTLPYAIGAGKTSTVTFKVTVVTIPTPNPIPNSAIERYTYLVDGTTTPNRNANGSGMTNTVTTQINNANLNTMNKTVNKNFATIGDILTYTIAITNTGNVSANGVIFQDTIPIGTTLVANSFTINGVTQFGVSPNPPGTSIGTIPAGATFTIGFNVQVLTIPAVNPIPNSATTGFNYVVNPVAGTTVGGSGSSNTVTTKINTALVTSQKSTDIYNAMIGDTVVYTIVLNNSGNVTANNMLFIDTIPIGMTFISNSVFINGTNQPGLNPAPPSGMNINSLGIGATMTISFSVLTTSIPS